MLDAFLGPWGGILAGIVSVVAALILGRWQGRAGERKRRDGQDAEAYRDTRKEIDNADIGTGATDAERVRMLDAISNRRGSGKD